MKFRQDMFYFAKDNQLSCHSGSFAIRGSGIAKNTGIFSLVMNGGGRFRDASGLSDAGPAA